MGVFELYRGGIAKAGVAGGGLRVCLRGPLVGVVMGHRLVLSVQVTPGLVGEAVPEDDALEVVGFVLQATG